MKSHAIPNYTMKLATTKGHQDPAEPKGFIQAPVTSLTTRSGVNMSRYTPKVFTTAGRTRKGRMAADRAVAAALSAVSYLGL